jgi:hypothetical protein
MRRPSFQFYPGDWVANPNLRRCSHAEKGAWMDILCLLHDQADYGILRWPLKEIAQAVGCSLPMLHGLVAKGVLKGDDKHLSSAFVYIPRSGRKDGEPVTLVAVQDGPVWYSSRMVRDEYVRTVRGEGSRYTGGDESSFKPALKATSKLAPKHPFGDGSSSSSSSSTSSSMSSSLRSEDTAMRRPRDAGYTSEFEAAWILYPDRPGDSKAAAGKAWKARIAAGVTAEAMTDGVRRYAAHCAAAKTPGQYIKQASTFFGPGEHYLSAWELPTPENNKPAGKHTGFEKLNYREGVNDDGTFA